VITGVKTGYKTWGGKLAFEGEVAQVTTLERKSKKLRKLKRKIREERK